MVEMGILPMKGKASFSSHVLTFSCVMAARFAAVLASQSRATASKVLAAASALAAFPALGGAGVDAFGQQFTRLSRRFLALASDTAG
jgi:hypothetical protein